MWPERGHDRDGAASGAALWLDHALPAVPRALDLDRAELEVYVLVSERLQFAETQAQIESRGPDCPVLAFRCLSGEAKTTTGTSGSGAAGKKCQAGYSPCLPIVGDLNCGEIPDSLKPIRVTGRDPYRLDGDRNGYGCEAG